MRVSVCMCVCVCVTLFFQFFLCHEKMIIFNKQKTTNAPKTKFLFVTKYLAEPLICHPKKMKKWDHDRLFLPKYLVCPTFCDAYPVELVNKNLTEAQPGLTFWFIVCCTQNRTKYWTLSQSPTCFSKWFCFLSGKT